MATTDSRRRERTSAAPTRKAASSAAVGDRIAAVRGVRPSGSDPEEHEEARVPPDRGSCGRGRRTQARRTGVAGYFPTWHRLRM
ncbi:hypothetical protein GCM10010236_51500 [Streptomyces eurythermus]|nr:hypothetical protein GCM10010236_51500 [Streptomyces eurythermus]